MGETKISAKIQEMVDAEFPTIALSRKHCGGARLKKGGWIQFAPAGWLDRDGYLPDGRYLAIEVKDPNGKTDKKREALQEARRADINAKNGVGLLVESVEQARTELRKALTQCET